VTDLPFRLVAREFGCGLCFTEMVSANGLVRETAKTLEYLKTCPEDRPLGVQIFGADPAVMAEAARIVGEHDPDILDLNMGCPVRKVVKTGAGAMLMKDLPLAGRIIAAVVRASKGGDREYAAGWSGRSKRRATGPDRRGCRRGGRDRARRTDDQDFPVFPNGRSLRK
jgi:tRNA-dihydrouridine synthase